MYVDLYLPNIEISLPLFQIFAKQFDKAFETGLAASHNDKIAQHTLTQSTDKDVWKSDRNKLSPMFATARFSGERFAKIRTQITRMWTHVGEAHLQGRPINMKQVCINWRKKSTLFFFARSLRQLSLPKYNFIKGDSVPQLRRDQYSGRRGPNFGPMV